MRWRNISWLPARPWLGAQRVHVRPSRAGLAFAALLPALWIAAVCGNGFEWRGNQMDVKKDSLLATETD